MPGRDHLRLSRLEQSELLGRILQRSAHDRVAPSTVVAFDLDGTLMDNRPRTCAILHEFANARRARDEALARRLLAARPRHLAYLFHESMERLGVEGAELVEEMFVFWRDRFFADAHLKFDVPVRGAVSFASACHASGAIVVYITGRDLPQMGVGTFRSLRDLGFPIGVPRTELVMKPDGAISDAEFKRTAAPTLARLGTLVASFDNEPGNTNLFRTLYPDAESVLLDTQNMPGAPAPDEGVHVISDFSMDAAHGATPAERAI